MRIVFTDLDGTLLDGDTYSFEAARPALARLRELGIPLVFASSKTRAEVQMWRERLENTHPFIVENGGAVFVPRGYLPFHLPGAGERDGYEVIEFGDRYEDLVQALRAAAAESGAGVVGFHQLSAEEISARCGLPLEQARLARQREYDEPFEILDPSCTDCLIGAIRKRGKRCTRGGRFYHITGNNDKAAAVRLLAALYRGIHGQILTVGLGDGWNDLGLLEAVDMPVLISSPQAAEIHSALPRARLSTRAGAAGWNAALLEWLRECAAPAQR